MQVARTYLPETRAALNALGAQIAAARRQLGWTAADLGERIGASPALVSRIEKGAPGTSVGVMLEAAVVCGVPLFGADNPADLDRVAASTRSRLALLPSRVRPHDPEVSDDF